LAVSGSAVIEFPCDAPLGTENHVQWPGIRGMSDDLVRSGCA